MPTFSAYGVRYNVQQLLLKSDSCIDYCWEETWFYKFYPNLIKYNVWFLGRYFPLWKSENTILDLPSFMENDNISVAKFTSGNLAGGWWDITRLA